MGQFISSCKPRQPKRAKITSLFKKKKATPVVPPEFRKFFPEGIEQEECFKRFGYIFRNISFDELPGYMLLLREGAQQHRDPVKSAGDIVLSTPTIQTPALFGSMHVAFVIVFPDGLRWLLKIPANGYPGQFTKLEAKSLTSEALTMQLVRRETKVPLPDVYAFDSSFDNPINSPYILMKFVEGVPLYEVWFDEEASTDAREQHRETALREIAYLMPQLNKFTLRKGGSPLFDSQNNLIGADALKELDLAALWDTDDSPAVFRENGPFSNLQSYLRSFLPRAPKEIDGFHKLFLHFLEWIPDYAGNDANDQPFVLTHTDLNLQNIFVTPDGHVTSLIDWDGAALVPRCLGNERYPGWLLSDWNPLMYNWTSKPDAANCDCAVSNSPQDLARYRAMYEKTMLEASQSSAFTELQEKSSPSTPTATPSSPVKEASKRQVTSITKNSLILATLKTATNHKHLEPEITSKIYDEIIKAQTNGQYKTAGDLSVMDRRNLYTVADMLEAEEKLKKKKEQDKGSQETSVDSENDEDGKGGEDEDDEDGKSIALSYEAESEEDEDEALRKRLEWIKEGYQKLFA